MNRNNITLSFQKTKLIITPTITVYRAINLTRIICLILQAKLAPEKVIKKSNLKLIKSKSSAHKSIKWSSQKKLLIVLLLLSKHAKMYLAISKRLLYS